MTQDSKGRALRLAAALLGAASMAAAIPARAQDTTPELQVVDTMNKLFGRHPATRANHAKGLLFEGSFTAAPGAHGLSRAAFLQSGTTTPVLVRFSDATGIPDLPDGAGPASPHGLAVRFHQGDGTDIDMVNNGLKFFPVRTVEEFLALLQAVAASPANAPKPTPLDTFVAAHPKVAAATMSTTTPASFALESYQGVNAFIFTNAAGQTQAAWTRIAPVSGVAVHLPDEEAAKLPPDYLMHEIASRISQGPVGFHLLAQLAEPGDAINDATVAWPDTRKEIDLGTITVSRAVADSQAVGNSIVFMPTNLTDGIEPSGDPLIQSRVGAYAESFSRRQQ